LAVRRKREVRTGRDNMGKIGKMTRSNQKMATLAVSGGRTKICRQAKLQITRLALKSKPS
jgi:hypothetical protein